MNEIRDSIDNFKPTIHKHESFYLRRGWLHKGMRNVKKDASLFTRSVGNENKACDLLGIGTNMVKSMRYWLNATGMIFEDGKRQQYISSIGEIINEYDPYFEERGTNYIVHYLLASNKVEATAWWWFFNEYKGSIIDKPQFIEEFAEFCFVHGNDKRVVSQRVLESEFNTLMSTYYSDYNDLENLDPEETKICPLVELRLVSSIKGMRKQEREKEFKKTMPDKDDIHPWIVYAVIAKKQEELNMDEIHISELLSGENNIGKIFNLDRSTIFYIIEKIERLGLIKITRTAGLDVIHIKRKVAFEECLRAYYRALNGEVENG